MIYNSWSNPTINVRPGYEMDWLRNKNKFQIECWLDCTGNRAEMTPGHLCRWLGLLCGHLLCYILETFPEWEECQKCC